MTATSIGWCAGLEFQIADTPISGLPKYAGPYQLARSARDVWTEHSVLGGFKVNLGAPASKRIEPMQRLPLVLRSVMTF